MSGPVISARLGTGRPRAPGRVRIVMSTNMPPAGSAGVLVTIPATLIVIGPIRYCEVSWTAPVPRTAAADGEASTGMTVFGAGAACAGPADAAGVAGAGPKALAGTRGNGVSAVTAAYPAGSTSATV